MQTTFKDGLGVSFRGKITTPGMPAYVENGGIRTVGGLISNDNENEAKFGLALFAAPEKPGEFFVGKTAAATLFRGILLNRPMVNEQFPGHADRVFNGTPADAIYQGSVWVEVADGKVGDKAYAAADGTISNAGTSAIGQIVESDPNTGLFLVHLDGTAA